MKRTATAILLVVSILASNVPSFGAEKETLPVVSGIVTDESGKPLAGVAYWISAREHWSDGKWELVFFDGDSREYETDENGRFEIKFHGKARYDLQFYRQGYAPAFLFQVPPDSPELNVRMEKGLVVKGQIEMKGKERPNFEAIRVFLRLPNSRGRWFKRSTLVSHDGAFQFSAGPPPNVPGRARNPTWQLVCVGEVAELNLEKDRPVDEVVFEITTSSRIVHGQRQ